ncbi:flagellar export protein FliJ [Clostridium sp. DJ247]|uniref:flagellar export protein FliJ n=1 Tax=Clostridium sp. DJ247 TaxID=2726188 RepID=UPI00162A91E0|nr:flagellar export protein FliJ [Clostridium sp. DJ247]MBC2582130.1 flagellar export protein FliJ [Clostridium sp. DJ247]
MDQYQFRLQRLLDIRLDKEEESKRSFRQAQEEKLKVENKLNTLKENYEKHRNIQNSQSVIESKIRHLYLNAINYNINEAIDELEKKEKILNDRRNDLKQKQIDRKTVESLKDKEFQAFLKENELKEQKMNDEFALYAFVRNFERR